jgi:hypothetical protein
MTKMAAWVGAILGTIAVTTFVVIVGLVGLARWQEEQSFQHSIKEMQQGIFGTPTPPPTK